MLRTLNRRNSNRLVRSPDSSRAWEILSRYGRLSPRRFQFLCSLPLRIATVPPMSQAINLNPGKKGLEQVLSLSLMGGDATSSPNSMRLGLWHMGDQHEDTILTL